jgi:CRISPR-associated protein Csy3
MTQVFKKLPGVLAFNRRIHLTDVQMFSVLPDEKLIPVQVTRGGLRGTQNLTKPDPSKRPETSNVQQTDTAKTAPNACAVAALFAITYYPIKEGLKSLALSNKDPEQLLIDYRASYESFIERAKTSDGLQEVSRRFARNIANGRWLWRNRTLAKSVSISVKTGDESFVFDALRVPLHHFKNYLDDEKKLGSLIRDMLAGDSHESLRVNARIDFGDGMNGSVEVYPSQNYVGKTPKGFARSLYAIGGKPREHSQDVSDLEAARTMGQAAIRDTKAANAIRTIDTWYGSFEEHGQPIAIEPAGANLDTQAFFRPAEDSAFAIAKQLNIISPDSPEGMFMIAALVRGGVYSEGGE